MARSSSSLYWVMSTGSVADMTPPEAQIFFGQRRDAAPAGPPDGRHRPRRRCERTRPGTRRPQVRVGDRALVAVAAGLAERLAGHEQPRPVDQAALRRLARPTSQPPASRTVVKPRRTWLPAEPSRIVRRLVAIGRWKSSMTSTAVGWTWASMSPGITVRPARSMTRRSGRLGVSRPASHLGDAAVDDEQGRAVDGSSLRPSTSRTSRKSSAGRRALPSLDDQQGLRRQRAGNAAEPALVRRGTD